MSVGGTPDTPRLLHEKIKERLDNGLVDPEGRSPLEQIGAALMQMSSDDPIRLKLEQRLADFQDGTFPAPTDWAAWQSQTFTDVSEAESYLRSYL